MKRDLPALANSTFDVLVIGGGIIGAGIAREVAEWVAALMAARLGWTGAQQSQQVADYLHDCQPRFS